MHITNSTRGMTLIDVLIGSALVLIIFYGLMGMLRASISVSALAKARAGAASLAQSQMEYLRGISYDSLGTIGGIPSGVIHQTKTEVLNNETYTIYTYIQYIDDPADGIGVNDTNGITTDYKIAKVTVTYKSIGMVRSVILVSNFSPPGIETTNDGGTLVIHVVNATGVAVVGATVHITDAALSPTIDFSAFSNTDGIVSLPGAPPSTEYQVAVTKNGYSSAQTYIRTTTNQNPTPGYLTVVKEQTTTGTFAIDFLASFTLRTYKPIESHIFYDTFTDESLLAATSSVEIINSALNLYTESLAGSARSISTAPTQLHTWTSVSADTTIPSGSSVLLHVYTGSGVLLPDTVLPGNSTGFSAFPINLSGISTSTYPTLSVGANISRTATTTIPQIFDWSLKYTTGPVPLPNVSFTLTGAKTIGSTGKGAPIYKTIISQTTNSNGESVLSLEWDAYALSVNGYDITDACPMPPYALAPNSVETASLTLSPLTTNRLLIHVQDVNGNPIHGAAVTLSRTGYTKTDSSSSCANAYFGGLSQDTDYTITLIKSGYTTTTIQKVSVTGQTFYTAAFQ